MNYNYITFVPLETCIGNSLNTFNVNYTSLDLNIKELSSSVESRTNFLSSTLQSVSAAQQNRIMFLSSQIPVISSGIVDQLSFVSLVSSVPNNSIPVILYSKQDSSYDNIDTGIVAKGTGATLARAPNNSVSGGNKRGSYATDFQFTRANSNQVAGADYSVILNGTSNSISSVSGQYSFIGAGNLNYINSQYSNVLAGTSNSALSAYCSLMGNNNFNQIGNNTTIFGNRNTTLRTLSAFTATGFSPVTASSGSGAFIIGTEGQSYYENQAIYSNGDFTTIGDAQHFVLILRDFTQGSDYIKHMAPIAVNGFNIAGEPTPPGLPMPNFRMPGTGRRIWDVRLTVTAVTSSGLVDYYSTPVNFIWRTKNDGSIDTWENWGTFYMANHASTGNSFFIGFQGNYLFQINVSSFPHNDTPRWNWTAVLEINDMSWPN